MTKAQRRVLEFAADCPRLGFDGVCSKGPRRRAIKALESAGLLRFVGFGSEEDSATWWKEWPIYEITDAGRAVITPAAPAPADPATSEEE